MIRLLNQMKKKLKGGNLVSKSRIVTIIVSLGVIVILGVGTYFMYSNKKTPDDVAKVEEKEKNPSNEVQKENKEKSSNTPNSSNNPPNASHENNGGGSTENNNPSNNNENNNNSNNNGSAGGVTPRNPEKSPSINPVPPQGNGGNNSGAIGTPESPSVPSAPSDSNFAAEIEQLIYQRVNSERAAAGLPGLSYNTTMEKYARIKSADMGEKGYFSHEDPQGKLITDTMKADGVSYNSWGENIAYIQGKRGNEALATEFMNNWMNSSGHRANILSTNFTSIGVGVYKIGNTYYATQEFYR